jgi:hypothetical protein
MKIGKFYYPRYDLSTLLDEVKILYDEYGKTEITREHIATKLKCSPTSGGFGQKLADFRAYGLLDGRGTFHVTDMGMKASGYGTEKERAESMDSAVRKIELWRLIHAKWGTSIPADTFWIDLAEITGVERSESKKEADTVRKAYMDDARYLLSVKAPENPPESEKAGSGDDPGPARGRINDMETTPTSNTKAGVFPLAQFQFGESRAVIMDKTALDVIIAQLTTLRKALDPSQSDNKDGKEG